jgi:hypothetical protein
MGVAMTDENDLSPRELRILQILSCPVRGGARFGEAVPVILPPEPETKMVWNDKDDEGVEFELIRIMKDGKWSWQLSATKGPFSGYPTIELNYPQMFRLAEAIDDELDEAPFSEDR